MKKDLMSAYVDEKYYQFLNLFSRFQADREEFFKYYEWYKIYGDFSDLDALDKYGKRVGKISEYTERDYEKFAFEKEKSGFLKLAHKGSLHATMFYLFMENPKKWDKKIVNEIEKLEVSGDKSPEILGCVAGLHRRDYANAFGDASVTNSVKNVYDLCEVIADNWYQYNYAACVGYHGVTSSEETRLGECASVAINCYKQLKMYSQEYVKALGEMQKAFYSRFLNAKKSERNYFDIAVLLKTKNDFPDEIFAPGVVNWEEFANLSNGRYYSFGRFGSMLNREKALHKFNKLVKKSEAFKPALEVKEIEFASAALVVGGHNFGATTTLRQHVLERAKRYIEKSADLLIEEKEQATQAPTQNHSFFASDFDINGKDVEI